MNDKQTPETSANRRDFLKTGAVTAAAAGFPAIISAASVDNAINVGLVGAGGRGTGAAAQAMAADDFAHLTAIADVADSQIEQSLERLKKSSGDKVQVEPSHQFLGLDAYEKVIDSDVDVVILATPPGFRPPHVRRTIEAGKHLFCEKPVAVDSPGVRAVLESSDLAAEKGVSIVSGFCWRYSNYIQETFEQMDSGAIGKLITHYATYYTNPVKPMPPMSERPAGMSDATWGVSNWYNFVEFCGDSLVEQAIHSVDKVAWLKKDVPPVSCVAVGGRQVPANAGNIYDHFSANYLYEDGFRGIVASRQIPGCHNENADYILGADGTCTIGKGPIPQIEGKNRWAYRGDKYNMYQREHDVLFQAIRRGELLNDGRRMATSTLMGLMGRQAAYTGQEVTWDQIMNSEEVVFDPATFTLGGDFDPRPMPVPGRTQLI